MTSDAKIGLLLGLTFIFIIAFILNGLPNFSKDTNNNELTTNIVGSRNNPLGIGARQRKVSRDVISQIRPVKRVQIPQTIENPGVRFKTALPKSSSGIKEVVKAKSVTPVQSLPTVEKKQNRRNDRPKVYVVSEGDNLAIIAKKFYGSEDGNKRVNITRVFEANRKLLKSPDEIYEGQKLIVPPLLASAENKSRTSSILASSMLEKVESIGKRHLPADGRKPKPSRWYVVQEGDSLWRIAAEQLGDGNRYSEIAELNAGILDDEDSLVVGVRLKMPVR